MLACTETSTRAEAGSSQTTSGGWPAKARAMATRCFWPPESSVGFASQEAGLDAHAAAESLSTWRAPRATPAQPPRLAHGAAEDAARDSRPG